VSSHEVQTAFEGRTFLSLWPAYFPGIGLQKNINKVEREALITAGAPIIRQCIIVISYDNIELLGGRSLKYIDCRASQYPTTSLT